MANMLFANNCNTTLNGGITAIATSMVVTSATGFPVPTGSQYFYCTLADAATQTTIEIVKVTAVSGTTFTIVRGQDGTTGTIFASGAVVSLRLVAASLNDFPKLDEANTFTGVITFSTPLLATNMVQSTTSTSGYLSNTDWNTFNNKSNTNGTVTSVAALTLGTTGTDLSSTVANGTTTPVITLQVPTASAVNRGALSAADWSTFNGKAPAVTYTTGYIPFGQGTTTPNQSSALQFDGNNLGIKTTPSAWGGNFVGSLELANGTALSSFQLSTVSSSYLTTNAYNNGSNWIYKIAFGASQYQQLGGGHYWFTAPSGTAGSNVTFTQAMQIAASGGVSIGNTTDPGATNLSITGTTTLTAGARTGKGTITVTTATPTTLFSASAEGRYDVAAYIQNVGDANYAAFATVISTGADSRIVASNGAIVSLTISGGNVKVTQISGSNLNVTYSYIKMSST